MTIFGASVRPAADAASAAWIAPELGEFGTVGGLVPARFERYLLVEHASLDDPESWAASAELLEELASVAAHHTTTPDLTWFAIWEGYGWAGSALLHAARRAGPVSAFAIARKPRRLREEDQRRAKAVRAELAGVVRFDLPNRRYYLLRGPLDAVSRIERPDHLGSQPPDLWWPDDRRWFIASDTDLTWSYVGGSERFLADVARALAGRTRAVEWTDANSAVLR